MFADLSLRVRIATNKIKKDNTSKIWYNNTIISFVDTEYELEKWSFARLVFFLLQGVLQLEFEQILLSV